MSVVGTEDLEASTVCNETAPTVMGFDLYCTTQLTSFAFVQYTTTNCAQSNQPYC
jgi:hypothetical protein